MIEQSILVRFKRIMLYFFTCFFLVAISIFTYLNFLKERSAFDGQMSTFESELSLVKDKLLYASIVGSDEMIADKLEGLTSRHPSLEICSNLGKRVCGLSGKRIFIDPSKALFVQVDSKVPLFLKALSNVTNIVFFFLFLLTLVALNRFLTIWLERNLIRPLMDFARFFRSFKERRNETNLPRSSEVAEWNLINQAINSLMEELRHLEAEVAVKATGDLSRQVAHDIRSPLTALNFAVENLEELPLEKRQLIEGATKRISEIAEDLLSANRQSTGSEDLRSLVASLVTEKKFKLKGIKIDFSVEAETAAKTKIDSVSLKRIVSNILDNSIESLRDRPEKAIRISLAAKGLAYSLDIVDSGCGIPGPILSELGRKKITYGKSGQGNGIGLLNSINWLRQNGDKFEIQSTVGEGTAVRLTLGMREH